MVYVIALVVAVVGSYQFLGLHQWLLVLIGHLLATVVVFIASQLYKNSSLYDPFWSVAPIPIAIYVAFWPESSEVNIEKVILKDRKKNYLLFLIVVFLHMFCIFYVAGQNKK